MAKGFSLGGLIRRALAALPEGSRKRLAILAGESLSETELADALRRLAGERAEALPPEAALRFLFGIDERLYPLQGRAAIRYGGGLHTKHRHMKYHDFFVGRIRPGEQVLDVGCGNGSVAWEIAERAGAHVLGVDLSAENIARARERCAHPRAEYRVGDALTLTDAPRFDVAVLSNVLEHLPGRPAFLRRLLEHSPQARFLIRVPLFERDWRVPLKQELGVEWRLDLTHETEYTRESFQAEMDQAGLSIIHQEVRWGEIWAEAVAAE